MPPTTLEEFGALLQEYITSCNGCFLKLSKERAFEAVKIMHEVNFGEAVCQTPH